MPTIAYFFGIRIVMYVRKKEHNPPHVHVFYQDDEATFSTQSGEMLEGALPVKQRKEVKAFILQYREELEEMWESGQYENLPPIM